MRSLMSDRYLKKFRRQMRQRMRSAPKSSIRKKPPDPESSINQESMNMEGSIEPQRQSTSPGMDISSEDERQNQT